MKKAFPAISNTLLLIAGVGSVLAGLPLLCIVCLLLLSLIPIWTLRSADPPEDSLPQDMDSPEKEPDDALTALSLQIQQLTLTNQRLTDKNKSLAGELAQCRKKHVPGPHPIYDCPLTCALPVNLDGFFTEYLKGQAPRLNARKLRLEYDCSSPDMATYLSPAALTLICDNVLDNIIKFGPRSDTVYLRITLAGDDSLIIFKNGSEGPEGHEMEQIFDLNYQGSNKKSGTGLGLAQVRALVEDFGGHVWAKSAKGTGFTLYIRLPR